MNDPLPHSAVTGAAMDMALPRRRRRPWLIAAGIAAALLLIGYGLWELTPHGLQVPASDVRMAPVSRGVFHDDIAVRAIAEPLNSVILDSVESGRVEEVFARDGALVKQGELLFRLSNPQRHLELLARQSEHAQQISNLANLRVALEASRSDHRRRSTDIEYSLDQAQKQHARNEQLAAKGFISPAVLQESADKVAQQRRALEEERTSSAAEFAVKRDAMAQMEQAIARLQNGLKLVNATVEALAVRAPVAGRLTDFRLQVGETVKQDQRIGRIDDPARFKLAAQLDEFYLGRVAVGRHGAAMIDNRNYAVDISRVYPQIKDGRFAVELVFTGAAPAALNPGQGMDVQITLGNPTPALLLPAGAFLNDTGGAWAFVVGRDGATAERRTLRIGRRSSSQVEVLSGVGEGEKVIVSGYAAYGKAERLQLTK